MIIIKRFVLMIQFLTTIPIPFELKVDNEDFGKGLVFAPAVGLILGVILALSYFGLSYIFPPAISVIIILIEYIFLTGGLHLDGLGDSFDGLFSNRPKERILEIMRDSRVGTNAVLAIVSVLLLNISLLSHFSNAYIYTILIMYPAAGRVGSIIGASISNYARKTDGLGKSFIDYCSTKEFIIGVIIYFAIFLFITGGVMHLKMDKVILLSVIPPVSAIMLTKFFSRKIGGTTGDILGAVCEINQTIFLLSAYVILMK